MKRLLALALAGTMLLSLPVMAAPSPTAAVVADGVSEEVRQAAAEENMTVVEYTNNAVVEVPGLTEATPAGQGGHVVINGAPSNITFNLVKPTAATVATAKEQVAGLEEAAVKNAKVINVFGTKAVVGKFTTAQVNFYMKGVKAGQDIRVYQLVKGKLVELKVLEIREDHVVVEMTSHGTLVFVEYTTETVAQ